MERYRIRSDAALYYLTYSIVEWLPIFVSEATCKIITDSLTFCYQRKNLRINAYVIMPTHLHVIAFDAGFDSERLNRTLTDFRKFTGRQLSDHCREHGPGWCHDIMLKDAGTDRERRCWQPSRHPIALLTEPFWRQKVDYLHDNPYRKGLVRRNDHWRFSSAAWHLSECEVETDVPLTPIEW